MILFNATKLGTLAVVACCKSDSELGSRVKNEVAALGHSFLIVLNAVSVDVTKQKNSRIL